MDTAVVDTTNWVAENARVWAHLGYRLHVWMDIIKWMAIPAPIVFLLVGYWDNIRGLFQKDKEK